MMLKLIKKKTNQKSTWKQRAVVWGYVIVLGLAKSAMACKENTQI